MGALSRSLTKDGFELHLGTNHLGPYLLTALFLPWIKVCERASRTHIPHAAPTKPSRAPTVVPALDLLVDSSPSLHITHASLPAAFAPQAAAASSPGYVPRIVLVASFMHWAGYLHRDDMHMDKSFSGPAAYGQVSGQAGGTG